MPTYDYECEACGESTEIFHSITAEPKTDCPACGKPALKRLIGAGSGFLFKGSGFYITDYRSSDYKAKAKAEASGSGSSSSSGSGSDGSKGSGSKSDGSSSESGSKASGSAKKESTAKSA